MTEYIFSNNAESTLASAMGGGDTTLTVATGEGALFPSPASGQAFYILVQEGSTSEWMLVQSRSGDVFSSIVRGGSNSFSAGGTVKLVLNATVLGQFAQKGVFREVATSPDGSLSALYTGEEVLLTTDNTWWKHCTGTTWKLMNGSGS